MCYPTCPHSQATSNVHGSGYGRVGTSVEDALVERRWLMTGDGAMCIFIFPNRWILVAIEHKGTVALALAGRNPPHCLLAGDDLTHLSSIE